MQKKIDHLKKMNLEGTYEKNIDAFHDLEGFFDEFPMLNVLMSIDKAERLCDEHEPSKASKFFIATSNIFEAMKQENPERVSSILDEILPQVSEVIQKYDTQTGKIQKGVSR